MAKHLTSFHMISRGALHAHFIFVPFGNLSVKTRLELGFKWISIILLGHSPQGSQDPIIIVKGTVTSPWASD